MWNWGTVRLEMWRYVKYNHVGVRQCTLPIPGEYGGKGMGQKSSIYKSFLYYTMHVILWTWQLDACDIMNFTTWTSRA
jgi:hypothetical protein